MDDPFTQRMLEKAEQRSRALGITRAGQLHQTKIPNQEMQKKHESNKQKPMDSNTNDSCVLGKQYPAKSSIDAIGTNKKLKNLHKFSTIEKENIDVDIEINIKSDKHIEVQVQVEEQNLPTIAENIKSDAYKNEQPLAKIRDTSRNRLQRLGALYSNTDDLSSPIHRTEGQFHEGTEVDASIQKPKQRYGKLAALADTINQWEDDTAHHTTNSVLAPPKPDLPSRNFMKKPEIQYSITSKPKEYNNQTDQAIEKNVIEPKQLKWDPKVFNSLEAQGFQRRDSSTVKISYDYTKDKIRNDESLKPISDVNICQPIVKNDSKLNNTEKTIPVLKSGLVSGRAAVFENKSIINTQNQRSQKDPVELSLKERMQLFEKNKGEALLPKAPFAMAPSINQMRQESGIKKIDVKGALINSSSKAQVKTNTDIKLREKVACLIANASTISENKIMSDIMKQRQEDMEVISNRFNKPKNIVSKGPDELSCQLKETVPLLKYDEQERNRIEIKNAVPPPPPPPMPQLVTIKRRSADGSIDEETKRVKTTNRLYPALSDFESNESLSEEDNHFVATTASAHSTIDEIDRRSSSIGHSNTLRDNESYMESESGEDSNTGVNNASFGRDVMQVVRQNEHQYKQRGDSNQKMVHYCDKDQFYEASDSSINSSEPSMAVNDYLDAALEDDGEESDDGFNGNNSCISKGSKGTITSNSFSFYKNPIEQNCQPIVEKNETKLPIETLSEDGYGAQPVRSELSVKHKDDNMVTLVHTVSFYRRQQNINSANSTPIRKVFREQKLLMKEKDSLSEAVDNESTPLRKQDYSSDNLSENEDLNLMESDSPNTNEAHFVQEKVKKLLEEVCKQQQIIGQTSQALNLCAATIEFSGSTESVEGERHLLVATHRRQACLDEIQRLRVEKSLHALGAPKEKGRLTVKEITVPLRQDYIRKLAAETISGHHLVCLLKYNEHVLATKTVPTLPGLLAVKFPDVLLLNNVYADFRITLEIYGMTAQREVLPHEVKYHINLNKKSGIKTPKKKGLENRLVMPPVQSPAGPNVVRTPALVQYGFAIFSLREIQRTTWTLTQVLGVSPLDGVVHMKVNCELSVSVEYKGFLTMYEDISGFGAWHRRWCHLNGTVINYWKYPDDEKKKAPMGTIDLYSCTSQKITTASRDICARLNTILLECERPAKETDKESLILVPRGRTTIVRYLLSADTREEREEWNAHFNKALTLLRAWGQPQ